MTQFPDHLLQSLPATLLERTRIVQTEALPASAEFVLYWMQTAIRTDENSALDVAIHLGNQVGLPVLICQLLSECDPYASDRHHTFVLQGARDVQASIERRGVAYAFQLERPGHRDSCFKKLASRAALIVTEDMPVEPFRGWHKALRDDLQTSLVVVDTACVVPMQLVGQAYDRAFAFRRATSALFKERVTRTLPPVEAAIECRLPLQLPFDPIDLRTAEIAELVSQCEIDHAIGPVPHTPGGSTAGYERWEAFKEHGLSRYAQRRNDALVDGVSRLSPYLHYGMVSPQRIAREAAGMNSAGAEKYLDELLIWRELAYAFCFCREDHASISALPTWAQATLAEHAADERPGLLSWETLARGRSGDLLWDAAQRSLLIQGELHNNVRMTWGKAILNWTRDAECALAMIIDLNHRYALDGRDPASYGGILWCLGQFDRPFPPPRPVLGTVRDRSTRHHAQRLDPQAYLRKTTRPLHDSLPTVAVVGAGISGLMCARTLADHGFSVTVFEKSRGVGGRMATRRAGDGLRFDHGAQYFTARDERFRRYVDSWLQDGLVAPWEGRIVVWENGRIMEEQRQTDRYVGVPGMNAVCKHLSAELKIGLQTRVAPLERQGDRWCLTNEDGQQLGKFDVALISAPAGQAADLLRACPWLADRASQTKMHGCWAVLLAFPNSLKLGFDGAFVHDSALAWIARNSSKPDRDTDQETWVLHASPEWSGQHLEWSPPDVQSLLIDEFWRVTGIPPARPHYMTAHRWRFSLPAQPLADRCLFSREAQLGACGDWCAGPRIEGAFLSGMAAAGRVLGLLESK